MSDHLAEVEVADLVAARARLEADPEVWVVLAVDGGGALAAAGSASAADVEPWTKPLVLAANGTVAGAGTALALAADVLLATPETSFHLPSEEPASEVLSAERAHDLGFVNELAPAAALAASAREWAEAIAAAPPLAVAAIREAATRGRDDDLATAIAGRYPAVERYAESADAAEAVRALVEGRPPRFRGA